jgi:hypothetical protein
MEVLKIDPTARYVIFVRDADPEWATKVEASLREWFDSPSKVIMVNVPGKAKVYLEKIREKKRETVH